MKMAKILGNRPKSLLPSGVPHILLVNPWIYDFAAYDFWAKPQGLLMLAAVLRYHGANVSYIDCLDRFHPRSEKRDTAARYGKGPYLKSRIPKPPGLEDIPRNYSRYGILPEWFLEDIKAVGHPDMVLVTSMMTYWYPGVQECISLLRSVFPEVPVILGGIYATLCSDHAVRFSGADRVVAGRGETQILDIVRQCTGWSVTPKTDWQDMNTLPFPAADLQRHIPYVTLMTSTGCPFSCAYCACGFLNPERRFRSPDRIFEEIGYWNSCYGVQDMVFYDDALLVDSQHHAIPLFEKIIAEGLGGKIRFHTPNAVHIREITPQIARLMFAAGFKTLRLGLETAGSRHDMDYKVTHQEFLAAVASLKAAGFQREQIGAYLLTGLPGQRWEDVVKSVEVVRQSGAVPIPAYFTPIPHTKLWPQAVASSRYDLEADPIFTNNAIFPCTKEPFSWKPLAMLKKLTAAV